MGKFNYFSRLVQIGVALVPVVVGFLALLNNITDFHGTVDNVVKPLITLQDNAAESWRALPAWLAPITFVFMLISEFMVGVFGSFGFISMIKNRLATASDFEKSKKWAFTACGWGILVWGLGFFAIGGDWFLAWQNKNLASFQQGALMYVALMMMVFIYLKLDALRK